MTNCLLRRWHFVILLLPLVFTGFSICKINAQTVACDPPSGLNSYGISTDQASLTWAHPAPGSVSEFQIEVRPSGVSFTGTPTHAGIAAAPFLLENLLSGQVYRFKARAVCGTDTSVWSGATHSFRTLYTNPTRCGASYLIRDNTCPAPSDQIFPIVVENVGDSLGRDVRLRAVRLVVDHSWRSDLIINLKSPDGTTLRLIEGLNAGDNSLGNPTLPCPTYLELTNDPGALPLGALFQVPFPTGRYQPRNSLTAFNNGKNPNGTWQLDICDQRNGVTGTFRWAELVFENTDCQAISGLAASNIDLQAADVSWQTDTSACDSIVVEWGSVGFLPGDGSSAGNGSGFLKIACPVALPLRLSGLAQFQWHEVFVRKKCPNGYWSANSQPVRFFTDCTPTLAESFENQALCDRTCSAPCPLDPAGLWRNMTSGDQFDWKVWQGPGPSTPNTGPYEAPEGGNGKYLYFETTCPPGNTKDSTAELRSNCILVNADPGQSCHFAFNYFMWNTSSAASAYGKLMVDISTNGGLSWTNLLTISGVQTKGWKHAQVSLAAFHGQVAVLRVLASGSVSPTSDIMLDNLRFYGSTDAGTPDYVFYRDNDSDGFGNPAITVLTCSPTAPTGFVADNTDCDDQNFAANPGHSETLCNGSDENCNGPADDAFISAPTASDSEACVGSALNLNASGQPVGAFFWFETASGGVPVFSGNNFQISNLTESKTYFLADSLTGVGMGCSSARTPVEVTAHPRPDLVLDNPDRSICSGLTFDLSTLPISDLAGAGGDFSYHDAFPPSQTNRLSGPHVSPSFSKNYFIVSTTSFGCQDVVEMQLEVKPAPTAVISNGDSATICKNSSIKLVASASGGTPPYRYAWSNGFNFQTIDVQGDMLGGGTHDFSVVATDSNECIGADLIKIKALNSVTKTQITAKNHVTTCGGSDGSIALTPLDGQAPYRFDWSGASTGTLQNVFGTGLVNGLKQGGYRFTITDAAGNQGCQMVMPQIVLNAPGLSAEVDSLVNPTCAGAKTGSISLKVQGQNPIFHWSNNSGAQNLSGLGEGIYAVTITDGSCQQVLDNLEVIAPDPIEILSNKITDVSCFGGQNGALDVAIFGGSPPFSITWSNAAATEDIAALAAGQFGCTVTDRFGCLRTAQFSVNQPPPLVLQATTLANNPCNGDSEGSVSAIASGGAGGFSFAWNTGANANFLNNLPAGNYAVTLTDKNNCTKTASTTVAQPPVLQPNLTTLQNPTCIGPKNGRLALAPTGGVQPYTYFWSSGQTTQTLENLDIGTYSVTVIDGNGCQSAVENIALQAPQLISIALDTLIPVRCHGENSGLISIDVAGGQQPYAVRWNQFLDDETLENVFAGEFLASVTDAQGCTNSMMFQMPQPAQPLSLQIVAQNDPVCFGDFNGNIEVITSGGTQPFDFQWSNGSETENLSELADGVYALTVTDARGCTTTTGILELAQPPLIEAFLKIKNIPCNGTVGSIEMDSIRGGVPGYQFGWDTPHADTTASVFSLPAGFYSLTIKDLRGCAVVYDSLGVFDTKLEFFVKTVEKKDVECFGENDGQILVELQGGVAPFRYAWSHIQGDIVSNSNKDTLTDLKPGKYSLVAIDADGCYTQIVNFLITENPQLRWLPASVEDVKCKNAATGLIETHLEGGLPAYFFAWSNGSSETNPDSLPAGVYHATVTDVAGCTLVSPPVVVVQPDSGVVVVLDTIWNDNCGPCRGAIFIHPEGGMPIFSYLWSNGETAQDVQLLCPGQHSVTVTDMIGCTQTADFQILDSPNPLDVEADITDVLCSGDSSGSISVMPFGGVPPYNLAWDIGHLTDKIENLPGGGYQLAMTDAAGCTKFFGFLVHEPDPLTATVLKDSLASGWTLGLTPTGGTKPYSTAWFDAVNNPIQTPEELPSGIYYAEVTDSNGCFLRLKIQAGTVSTDALDFFEKISLTPNPSAGKLLLSIDFQEVTTLDVEVFSTAGQQVFSKKWSEKSASWLLPLDLSELPQGIYFLKIETEKGAVAALRWVKI